MKFTKVLKAGRNDESSVVDSFTGTVSYDVDIEILKSERRDQTISGKLYAYVVRYENGNKEDWFTTDDYDTLDEVLADIRSMFAEEEKTIKFNK